MASAVSDECPVTVGGASEDLTHLQQRLQSLVDEAKAIVPEEIAGALRAPLAQAIEKASPIEGKTKAELETAISALVEAVDAARLSIPVMTALQAVVEDATDFLKAISASEAKDALVAAISEGQAVYASEASTVDDIEAARQALAQALSDTKKTAKPVDGQCFDMTEFLVNPSFESGKAGWLLDKQTGGWESFDTWNDRPAHEGSYFISLAYGSITSIDLYQVVEGLPAGVYSVQGALRNTDGADLLTDQQFTQRHKPVHTTPKSCPTWAERTIMIGLTSPWQASGWEKARACGWGCVRPEAGRRPDGSRQTTSVCFIGERIRQMSVSYKAWSTG